MHVKQRKKAKILSKKKAQKLWNDNLKFTLARISKT